MKSSALILVAVLLAAAPAAAQSTSEVADAVLEDGYYLDPDAVPIDRGALRQVARDTANAGAPVFPVILGADPFDGPAGFAQLVMQEVDEGTVVVLTDSLAVGVTSREFNTTRINNALDEADAVGGDNLTYLRNFVAALTGNTPAVDQALPTEGGGGSAAGFFVVLGIVAVLVVVVVVVMRRSRKSAAANQRRRIGELLDEMANDILELADIVEQHPEAKEHYVVGSAGYAEAAEAVEGADADEDLAAVMPALLESAWHLDAAEAIMEGRPVPVKPAPPLPSASSRADDRATRPEPVAGTRAARVLSVLGGVLGARTGMPRRRTSMFGGGPRPRRSPRIRGMASRRRRGTSQGGSASRRRRG